MTSDNLPRQETLDGEIAGFTNVQVFYRSVKTNQRSPDPEQQPISSPSELEDVEELLQVIRKDKLQYPIPLSDSKMGELPSSQVTRVINEGPQEYFVRDLLANFCDSLEGRQKAPNKYAMLVFFGDGFLLAHVKAERGMSLKKEEGEIELIRRFLDVDNILSAALFERQNEEIVFSHFTDTGSEKFREFLGVRERKYHYRKKLIQILCYYEGKREYECKFEFTNDEFEDSWLQSRSITLADGKFKLNDSPAHHVREIRWGAETYKSIDRFKSEFREFSFSLDRERDRYQKIISNPTGSDLSVYMYESAVDHRRHVELKDSEGNSKIIEKGDFPDNVYVVYANSNIDIDSEFAKNVFQDVINDKEITIFHPAISAAPDKFKINNIEFMNINDNQLSSEFRTFIQSVHHHAKTVTGETVSNFLTAIMFNMVERELDNRPIKNSINQIININTGNTRDRAVVSTKENEGDQLIEYKNKQHLETADDPAEAILGELLTETNKGVNSKIILWGITEQTREIDGLRTQSWNDDRVTGIQREVKDRLDDSGIGYSDYLMQPIELGPKGDSWVVAGIFY